MPLEVKLEDWSANSDANEAAVSNWFKKPGATVKTGDLLVELIVEKVSFEVESPYDGVLLEIKAPVGQVVSPGALLAILGTVAEWEKLNRTTVPPAQSATPTHAASGASEASASPIAKRLIRDNRITLEQVAAFVGSGVKRIGEEEVRRYLAAFEASQSSGEEVVPYAGLRRIIGERMSHSMKELAQLTLTNECDVTELVQIREYYKSKGETFGYTALIAKAVALSLPAHPYLNATLDGDEIHLYSTINLSIAMDTDKGLMVPVIKNAGKLSAKQINGEIERLSELARSGNLAVEDSKSGSFSITNLGGYDIDIFTPIINPPQAAVLGVGRIADRAGVINGLLATRKLMWLSLTFDHRLIDGAPAAAFLKDVKLKLEQPDILFS
ncbi:dihydrolipoamide acetyltransferase family protein [Candidatus Chlorohelix sp.]|uniref:dihydrolipoamide acetyltransferase family protein n=1 Tax=Candidatus Chlorohelix sp. TaxID=3139201 RepID=UPI00303F77AE